jgi:microcystin-dependent protein
VPLESATYINQLVATNPAHSDGLNQADSHMRLIKGVLQAQFPNFTAAALNSTTANIDTTVTTVLTNGVSILADGGVNFKTNTNDKITNPTAGEVDIVCANTAIGKFNGTGLNVTGNITPTGALLGPGSAPIGAIVIWPTSTLPTGAGVWTWCNGQAVSRTTYAAAFALLGTTYGAGNGSTTFNLPNYQETTLVGYSGMGGAGSPGLLTNISNTLKAAFNMVFGAGTQTLSTPNLPPYTPAGSVSVTGHVGYQGLAYALSGGSTTVASQGGSSSVVIDSQTFTGTAQGGTSTPFNTVQPSQAVNFIIRLA